MLPSKSIFRLHPSKINPSEILHYVVAISYISPVRVAMPLFAMKLLNQARAAEEIALVRASVCVCVSVCVSAPKAINNQWRDMV